VCRWFRECDARRRADDHLSLGRESVGSSGTNLKSGMRKRMAKLAALPIPLRNGRKHGSKAGYEKVQEQARAAGAGADRKAASA